MIELSPSWVKIKENNNNNKHNNVKIKQDAVTKSLFYIWVKLYKLII